MGFPNDWNIKLSKVKKWNERNPVCYEWIKIISTAVITAGLALLIGKYKLQSEYQEQEQKDKIQDVRIKGLHDTVTSILHDLR